MVHLACALVSRPKSLAGRLAGPDRRLRAVYMEDDASSVESGGTTWAWRPPSQAAVIDRRREASERATMQSYYELEHVPGHRFEFQQRVRTNKSFDLARDRSAARVRQAAKDGA